MLDDVIREGLGILHNTSNLLIWELSKIEIQKARVLLEKEKLLIAYDRSR